MIVCAQPHLTLGLAHSTPSLLQVALQRHPCSAGRSWLLPPNLCPVLAALSMYFLASRTVLASQVQHSRARGDKDLGLLHGRTTDTDMNLAHQLDRIFLLHTSPPFSCQFPYMFLSAVLVWLCEHCAPDPDASNRFSLSSGRWVGDKIPSTANRVLGLSLLVRFDFLFPDRLPGSRSTFGLCLSRFSQRRDASISWAAIKALWRTP